MRESCFVLLLAVALGCAGPTLLPPVSATDPTSIRNFGEGVPRDPEAAARYFRGEAERGVPEAQFNLGVLYARGRGVPRDDTQAVYWLRRAQERGIRQADVQLGALAATGETGDATPLEIQRWLLAAADSGIPIAQLRLASAYRDGRGVPRDYVLAYKWLNLATAAGEPGARQALDEIEPQLTSESVLEAQALARDWYRTHRGELH